MNDLDARVIFDLCAGTGAWSEPYLAAGYDVRRFDADKDVRLMEFDPALRVHGILAAPPCTMFARVGARWKRTPEQMREALSIVDACLRLVRVYQPAWWALENPIGKLKRYLGEPVFKCDPCDFGDPWTKRIWLWGAFTPPSAWRVERARTSAAFARAFFLANP